MSAKLNCTKFTGMHGRRVANHSITAVPNPLNGLKVPRADTTRKQPMMRLRQLPPRINNWNSAKNQKNTKNALPANKIILFHILLRTPNPDSNIGVFSKVFSLLKWASYTPLNEGIKFVSCHHLSQIKSEMLFGAVSRFPFISRRVPPDFRRRLRL